MIFVQVNVLWEHTTCRVAVDAKRRPRFGVGMYLRTTSQRNTDGSTVRYVQLAHNRRVEGVTQAQVLLNLGEDKLDPDGSPRSTATAVNRPPPMAFARRSARR